MLRKRAMKKSSAKKLFARAQRRIPGGVNSPVRAWNAVGGSPIFLNRGHGATITDTDGISYTDFVGSWGPLILGHTNQQVIRQVIKAAGKGTTFGAPTEAEVELAELVSSVVPSVEKVRMVSSGTEATMSALRLARAYTRRGKFVKFDGCYHGHSDGLLVKAGSGVATLSLPDSAGVTKDTARNTLIAKYNQIASVEKLFDRHGKDIAAVIVEPICGNMGVIPPQKGFLRDLRRVTKAHAALLIFDEIITGFRVALGGAQALYGIKPDLTCLGKILGGGLPLAAFGGRHDIMDLLAPVGPVYQAGTLSGNPLATHAGLQTLRLLQNSSVYQALDRKGAYLQAKFLAVMRQFGVLGAINRVGSMLTLFFGVERVTSPDDARRLNRALYGRFFHGMLRRGFYFPPAPFEAAFISLAHKNSDLDGAAAAFKDWVQAGMNG